MPNFNRAWIKITLLVAISFTALLLILNIVVISGSRTAFIGVIHSRSFADPYGRQVGYVQAIPTEPLEAEFVEQFQNSLLLVNILGVIASVMIGLLVSRLITQPLRKVEQGIKKLEESDYKFVIDHTGSAEFDRLIDEFNHLAQELAKMEDLRKDLISDTSHELKTPITTLMAQLVGVKDGVLELDAARTDVLLDQVHRLNDLVERLQEYSRLRSKTAHLNKTNFELRDVLDKLNESYEGRLQEAKVKLELNVPDHLELNADKAMFERIIINLMENALKYAKAKRITISADEQSVTVADDGVGIADEHMPYIFERFYRVEKSRNRDTGGLGLGLAIVKEIVEAHGWKITASAGDEGKGVAFRINT